MKYIKSLICNSLCINNLHKINTNGISIFKHTLPKKYFSFKKAKEYYLENDIYYDIYKDSTTYPIINSTDLFFENNTNNTNNTNNKNNKNKKGAKKYLLLNRFNKIKKIYKQYKYTKYNELTAEHIFPQSYIKLYKKAKYDMHNIYLTSSRQNSQRNNYKYVDEEKFLIKKKNKYYIDIKSELIEYNNSLNYKINWCKSFIPFSESRGVIARTIAYMKYKYNELIVENVIDLNVLLKWNKMYPPTDMEIKQNEKIKEIQGTENIFITNPKLVDELFNVTSIL
mgnify:CR=1 FL=1